MLVPTSIPVANFVQKTFEILRSQQHSSIISWLGNGKEFLIKDCDSFESEILPRYFRHRNVNSFIRQLNMYGFHKSRREPSRLIFSHPFFLQGRDELLTSVKRKLKGDEKEENEDGDKQQEKEVIIPQLTKASLSLFEQNSNLTTLEDVKTTKIGSRQAYFKEQKGHLNEEQHSTDAINSFFNIDYESFQLKNLMSKSFIFDNSTEIYQRLEEGPSLKEIGTEQYLNYCERGVANKNAEGFDLQSIAIRLFQTKHCIFELDI